MSWLWVCSPSVVTHWPQNKIRFLEYAQMIPIACSVLALALFLTISSAATRLNSWAFLENPRLFPIYLWASGHRGVYWLEVYTFLRSAREYLFIFQD